ncbi:serine/threonine protein kinase [Reinekea blandensis]|uniref:Stress response kinase A n=1 Tax=Reinekea blandensis MED297 TaxID=314283 RepID=A4BJ42_9GAMM|nr:serine/threonine protein kinase [Reinekea blandensis]EAR07887.1 Aminoglycoside phosphotransferase [Reinekea sp. MED297] [Reinekea blandensis MED297]
MSVTHPYARLTQDTLIDWLESLGLDTDYRIYPLNSFENRVYRVGIEDAAPMVFKVYRPGRWNRAQVEEELNFIDELAEADLDVIPAADIHGERLFERDGFLLAGFPMKAGHAFELDNPDKLYRIGQQLARLHNVGEAGTFKHRQSLSLLQPVNEALAFFADSDLIPEDIRANYLDTLTNLQSLLTPFENTLADCTRFRIHGDFHPGNILTRDDRMLIVDFDDTVTGPAMQDIWKLLSGSPADQQLQLNELEEGYEQFRSFPRRELKLIEPLRTAHMVRHALWIGRRWEDPAFPQAFPWYGSARYWSEHLLALREQWAALQDAIAQAEAPYTGY